MKAVSDLVYATLSGAATVTALVSDRIYPNEAMQEAEVPYMVFAVAADPGTCRDESDLDGALQVEIYDEDYERLQSIADATKLILSNGDWANGTVVLSSGRCTEALDERVDTENVKVLQVAVWGSLT